MTAQADGEWLTAKEVVARYKLASVAALYAMRSRGKGPKAHRFGLELRFHTDDLKAWEQSRAERQRTSA